MFRLTTILTAACLCASPAWGAVQTPQDIAERRAAAHRLFDPAVDQVTAETLAPLWEGIAAFEVETDERSAMRTAFDKELALINSEMKDRLAEVVARHVPLAEITPAMDSPSWQPALVELDTLASGWAVARGVEMSARVIEAGCAVRSTPSASCTAALGQVARYRSGELTVDEMVGDRP